MVGTNKKLKYSKGQMVLKKVKREKVELQLHESGTTRTR